MTTTENAERVRAWLAGRLPQDWFEAGAAGDTDTGDVAVEGALEVTVDREEILVVGRLRAPELPEGAGEADRDAAAAGRIRQFREATRDQRIAIARELEHSSGRKVAWGVRCDARREVFTNLSVPVMTRLRQPDRRVLDTLVAAGVARSRSDALAWCVRLVGSNTDEWLGRLREATDQVARVRAEGPSVD